MILRGMRMPKSCTECQIWSYCYIEKAKGWGLLMDTIPEWCPLIETKSICDACEHRGSCSEKCKAELKREYKDVVKG